LFDNLLAVSDIREKFVDGQEGPFLWQLSRFPSRPIESRADMPIPFEPIAVFVL
jgi:hypothetical protein